MSAESLEGSRRMSRAVGALLLVAGLLVAGTLGQAARLHRWFFPGERFVVALPEAGSFGLRAGGEVRVLGAVVGRVVRIDVDEQGQMTALVEVQAEFARFVGTDSRAVIRRTLGLAGDAFIEVSRGVEPMPEDEAARPAIPARGDDAPTETLQALITDLRTSVLPAVEEARVALRGWAAIADDLQNPEGDLQRLLANLRELVEGVESGRGVAGRLFTDQEMAERLARAVEALDGVVGDLRPLVGDLRSTAENFSAVSGAIREESADWRGMSAEVRDTLARVRELMADAKQTTARLPSIASDVEDAAAGLPGAVFQLQATLREAERVLQGLERHWLFRGSMPAEDARPGTRSPEEAAP